MNSEDFSTTKLVSGANNAPSAKAPILWALLALAYLFEIGAISVIINTKGIIQCIAATLSMVFPLGMMIIIVAIRIYKEDFLYVSIKRLDAIQEYAIKAGDKTKESYKKEDKSHD